jgi:hypothetical protein
MDDLAPASAGVFFLCKGTTTGRTVAPGGHKRETPGAGRPRQRGQPLPKPHIEFVL